MQDPDITAGVVYGVAPRRSSRPQPTVILENRPRSVFARRADGIGRDPVPGARPRVGDRSAAGSNLGEQGFAAVTGPANDLNDLDCDTELRRFRAGLSPSRPGLEWTLITRPAKVLGPYRDAARRYEARREERPWTVTGIIADGGYWCTGVIEGHHNVYGGDFSGLAGPDRPIGSCEFVSDHVTADTAAAAEQIATRQREPGNHADDTDPADQAEEPAGYRFNDHCNDIGDYCPWSGTPVSGPDPAEACPAMCRDSRLVESSQPDADPATAPVARTQAYGRRSRGPQPAASVSRTRR